MARLFAKPRQKKVRRVRAKTGLDYNNTVVRPFNTKCRANSRPGQFGAKKANDASDYSAQLRAKQTIRFTYLVPEYRFRRYYEEASRRQGATGEVLLQLLERRLDNVVYRMGFAVTRAEARQLVTHKAILVNGKTVNIPSFMVSPSDVISIREKAKNQARIQDALKFAEGAGFADWVNVNTGKFEGVFSRVPERSELPSDFNEQFVVELYSK